MANKPYYPKDMISKRMRANNQPQKIDVVMWDMTTGSDGPDKIIKRAMPEDEGFEMMWRLGMANPRMSYSGRTSGKRVV